MGLREDKKRRIRSGIIENAIALFREQGFESTRVRDIAARCELSEATFFNYFTTKDAVLGAWARRNLERMFEAGASDRGLRPTLRAVCDQIARDLEADRAFAASAWGRARMSPAAPGCVVSLVESGQRDGTLRRDLSPRQTADILYSALCGTIGAWLAREAPVGSLAAELRRTADLVLDGARRRNERVRPRSASAGAFSTR